MRAKSAAAAGLRLLDSRYTLLALSLLLLGQLILVLQAPEGDILLFIQVAKETNGIPGWSAPWTYPPLAGILIYPLRFFGEEGVRQYFALAISGTSLAVAALAFWRYQVPFLKASISYLMFVAVCLGVVFFYRFDSVTMATTVLGLLALSRGKDISAGLWLAVGGFVKSWPFVLALVLGTVLGRWRIALVVGGSALLVSIAGLAAGAVPWSWVTFASGREVQVESITALPAVWGGYLGLPGHGVDMMWYGAYGFAPYLGWVFGGLVVAFGAGLLALTVLRRKILFCPAPGDFWNQPRAAYLVAIIGSLLIVSPVLSTQFLLWIGAILAVALAFGFLKTEALFSLPIFALSGLLYPELFQEILANETLLPILVLTMRDLLLIALVFIAGLRVWRAGVQENIRDGNEVISQNA